MTVYKWDDGVLMVDGAVANDADCCCKGEGACCDGGQETQTALVTITGLTYPFWPNTCCPSLNGSYSLEIYHDDPDDEEPECCFYKYDLPDSQACDDELGHGPDIGLKMVMCRKTSTTASVRLEIWGSHWQQPRMAAWNEPNIEGLVPGECNWTATIQTNNIYTCTNLEPATVTF